MLIMINTKCTALVGLTRIIPECMWYKNVTVTHTHIVHDYLSYHRSQSFFTDLLTAVFKPPSQFN